MKINCYLTTSLHPYLCGDGKSSLQRKFNDPEYNIYIEKPEDSIGYEFWDLSYYICVFKLHIFEDEYYISQNKNTKLVLIYLNLLDIKLINCVIVKLL